MELRSEGFKDMSLVYRYRRPGVVGCQGRLIGSGTDEGPQCRSVEKTKFRWYVPINPSYSGEKRWYRELCRVDVSWTRESGVLIKVKFFTK